MVCCCCLKFEMILTRWSKHPPKWFSSIQQTPAISWFQIENDKLSTKNWWIYHIYKGVFPYRSKNDTEKTVDILFQVDIKWLIPVKRMKTINLPTYTNKNDI